MLIDKYLLSLKDQQMRERRGKKIYKSKNIVIQIGKHLGHKNNVKLWDGQCYI